MKCILHIGLEKTGTTSLQATLSGNRALLREKGILFPSCLGARSHTKLAAICRKSGTYDRFMLNRNISSVEQQNSLYDTVFKELKEQINTGDCHTLLISNEHLSSKLQTIEELKKLKEFIDNFCAEISIVVYLREQGDFFRSTISTEVKSGDTLENLPSTPMEDLMRYDYDKLLSLWSGVFGENAITVRVYEKETLLNNDVVEDFLQYIGVDGLNIDGDSRKNVVLGKKKMHLWSKLNSQMPICSKDKYNPLWRSLKQQLNDLDIPDSPITVENRRQIQKDFAESNAKVADRFLGKTQLFAQSEQKSVVNEETQQAGLLDEDSVIEFFSKLLFMASAKSLVDVSLLKAEQNPEAIEHEIKKISDAISFLPNNKYLYFGYAKLLFLNKELAESEEAVKKALELGFDGASAWIILSKIYEQKNDLGQSIEFMKSAIKHNDSKPNLLRRLNNLSRKAEKSS